MPTSDRSGRPLEHLALIMDGNGRWAAARGLPRFLGHKAGIEKIREIISAAFFEHNIKYCSLFAFSLENFRRPTEEVELLFGYITEYLKEETNYFLKNGICLKVTGELEDPRVPSSVRTAFIEAVAATEEMSEYTLNILFAYGGRQEIASGVRRVLKDYRDGIISIEAINENIFNGFLDSGRFPPVDLLIRTSGEQRVSNCLLYSLAYAELYFTKTYWPEFSKNELAVAVEEFNRRQRRFGGLIDE